MVVVFQHESSYAGHLKHVGLFLLSFQSLNRCQALTNLAIGYQYQPHISTDNLAGSPFFSYFNPNMVRLAQSTLFKGRRNQVQVRQFGFFFLF